MGLTNEHRFSARESGSRAGSLGCISSAQTRSNPISMLRLAVQMRDTTDPHVGGEKPDSSPRSAAIHGEDAT